MYAKPKSRRRKRLKRNRLYLMAAIFAVCCGGLTVAATLRALLAADEPATAVAPAFSDPVGPLLLRGTSDSSDYASASRGEGPVAWIGCAALTFRSRPRGDLVDPVLRCCSKRSLVW